jgi:3',5'-cyclic AMP phosphodiesterase CpdA
VDRPFSAGQPAATPATLVQISDLHIVVPGELLGGRVDTAACLRRAVEAIGQLAQKPLAVLVSGDLVDCGSEAEYRHLAQLLAPLSAPTYLMPGNHDDRDTMRRVFADHTYLGAADPTQPGQAVTWTLELPGCRVIALDSSVAGRSHGEIDSAQLAWLAEALAAAPTTPTIVALHHPPFATGLANMDGIGLRRGASELARLIERHRQVERIVSGHVHRSIQVRFGGTIALSAPSTAHQIALDLDRDAPGQYTLEPPGFLVHAWGLGLPMVSHAVSTLAFGGPYRYDE